MHVNRPEDFDAVYRITPIDGNRSDDDNADSGQRKKVRYQGRSWSEEEEDLPLSPNLAPESVPQEKTSHRPTFYADSAQMRKARALFAHLTTLEEKLAQLIFLTAEATYEPVSQKNLEKEVLEEQVGGAIFVKGDYKRQSYLIEHIQEISKTPLLIGNDFQHGLTFYFQERALPEITKISQKRASDLGKVVMVQNRRLGVHLQLDQDLAHDDSMYRLNQEERVAFRKGIRQAHGIVGRQLNKEPLDLIKKRAFPKLASIGSSTLTPVLSEQNVQEAVGLKTIDLVDLTKSSDLFADLQEAFVHSHDAFIVSHDAKKAICLLAEAVQQGIIKESEVEKRVFKILLVKSLFD